MTTAIGGGFLSFIKPFSYQTRSSSIDFFSELQSKKRMEDFYGLKSGDSIANFNWFNLEWINDPTVNSEIECVNQMFELFVDEDYFKWWDTLTSQSCPIKFHYIPINKANNAVNETNFDTESKAASTYIKMNARGKHLTEFENAKALLHRIDDVGEKFSNQYELLYIKIIEKVASKDKNIKGDIGKLSRLMDDYMMQLLINLYNDLYIFENEKAAEADNSLNKKIICEDYYNYLDIIREFIETKQPLYPEFPSDYFSLLELIFSTEIHQYKEECFIEYCKDPRRPARLRFIVPLLYTRRCEFDIKGISEWEYFLSNFHIFNRDENTIYHQYFANTVYAINLLAKNIHETSKNSILNFLASTPVFTPFENIRSVDDLDWKEEHVKAKIIIQNNLEYDHFDGIQKNFNSRIRAFLKMSDFWDGNGNMSKLNSYISIADCFFLKSNENPPQEIIKLVYLFATGYNGNICIKQRPFFQKDVYYWNKEENIDKDILSSLALAFDYLNENKINTIEMLAVRLDIIAGELYAQKDWRAFAITRNEQVLFNHLHGDLLTEANNESLVFPIVKRLDIKGISFNQTIPYKKENDFVDIGKNTSSGRRIGFKNDIKIDITITGFNADEYTFYNKSGTEYFIYRYTGFDGENHMFEKRSFNIQNIVNKYNVLSQKILTDAIETIPADKRNDELTKVIYWEHQSLNKKCNKIISPEKCEIGHYYNNIIAYFSEKIEVNIGDTQVNPIEYLSLRP
jgi:hypothetical protein